MVIKNSLAIPGVTIIFVVIVAILYYFATTIRMPIGVTAPHEAALPHPRSCGFRPDGGNQVIP